MRTLAITVGTFKDQVYGYRLREDEGQVRLEFGLKEGEKVWGWRKVKEGELEEMREIYLSLQNSDRGRWLRVE